jgi:hypothetical protein
LPDHSVAGLIATLTPLQDADLRGFKEHAHAAARELSSESDDQTIRDVVAGLL